MHQCNEIGFGSLGIVAIISVFIGAVSTIQTAYQLVSPLIPLSTIQQIVRDTVILEFAPTLVCVVLAGVAGSRIASELGNMRVSEQIDALEIMGINAPGYLIGPKILGALLTIPLLIILSISLCTIGGMVVGEFTGILTHQQFIEGARSTFQPYNLVFSMTKAVTFSFLIPSISAYQGYFVAGGSLEVGKASTQAVVYSSMAILVADYVLAQLML